MGIDRVSVDQNSAALDRLLFPLVLLPALFVAVLPPPALAGLMRGTGLSTGLSIALLPGVPARWIAAGLAGLTGLMLWIAASWIGRERVSPDEKGRAAAPPVGRRGPAFTPPAAEAPPQKPASHRLFKPHPLLATPGAERCTIAPPSDPDVFRDMLARLDRIETQLATLMTAGSGRESDRQAEMIDPFESELQAALTEWRHFHR